MQRSGLKVPEPDLPGKNLSTAGSSTGVNCAGSSRLRTQSAGCSSNNDFAQTSKAGVSHLLFFECQILSSMQCH